MFYLVGRGNKKVFGVFISIPWMCFLFFLLVTNFGVHLITNHQVSAKEKLHGPLPEDIVLVFTVTTYYDDFLLFWLEGILLICNHPGGGKLGISSFTQSKESLSGNDLHLDCLSTSKSMKA